MVPVQNVSGSTQSRLPIPRLPHQPMDPIFTRPRQFLHDFSSPLVSHMHTFGKNHASCKDAHLTQPVPNINYQISTGQQNLQQKFEQECKPPSFMPLNQETKNSPSIPLGPIPDHTRINGSKMSMDSSANNGQPNGPAADAGSSREGLAPALDSYSFYNRLCELFPDIHPPQLQKVYDACGRDFLRTIDNVLYARRLRKSVMAQIAKFRSQQRNQQSNNCDLNPQKRKNQEDSNLSDFANSNKYKAEKPQQSPKSFPNAKNATSSRAKRSRILAYQPPHTTSGNSSKRVSIAFPKFVQTAQGPGSSSQQCTRKPSSPPPNVFIHKIDKGQSVGGSGNATVNRESNERYFFSYKRPTANTLGALPQPTSHMNVPVSSSEEFNSFCHPYPPMPFYNPQQYTLTDWCHGGSVQLESHAPLIPEQQQEQNQQRNMNSESMSSMPQSLEQDHLPGDTLLQTPRQSNESGWSILFKNIMDPINSVDSNKDSNNVQHMEANEMYGKIDHNKQDSGHFIFKGNETSRYSFPPNSIKNHSRDNFDSAKVSDTTGGHPATQQENSSINDSLSEPINVTDVSRHESEQSGRNTDEEIKSSTSGIMAESIHSLVYQSDTNKLEDAGKYFEGAPGVQFDERNKYEEARRDLSSENHLVIDADPLTLREPGHDTQAGLDDDGYTNLLAM